MDNDYNLRRPNLNIRYTRRKRRDIVELKRPSLPNFGLKITIVWLNLTFLKNVESLWLCVFMMGFKGASLFPSSDTATGESLGFSVLSVLLCLFLLGRWGAGTRYGMRRDAPSLPAYKTEAPLTFFCGARSAVLSSTDISTYTCIRIQRNACTRILAWLSRCPNLNNAIGLP